MHQIIKFADMKAGSKYHTLVLVVSMSEGVARNGNTFVKLVLSDGQQNITASYFNVTLEEVESLGVECSMAAEVTLLVHKKYINVASICKNQNRNITPAYFKRELVDDPEGLFEAMLDIIRRHDHRGDDIESITDLTLFILDAYKDKFIRSSAAKSIHHNGLGGLLLHTVRMVDAAERLEYTYPFELDMEILICGTALHDIGKIEELETTEQGDAIYTPVGRLLGHSAIGMRIVDDFSVVIHCDRDRVNLLKHMIASHHGSLEYGAIAVPAIPEAMVLHALDMIDSRIYQFDEVYRNMEPGTVSGKIYGLDNSTVYLPEKHE